MNKTAADIIVIGIMFFAMVENSFGDNKQKLSGTFQPTVKSVGTDKIEVIMGRNPGLKQSVFDAQGVTQVLPPTNVRTFKVTSTTSITLNGLTCKLEDVHPGMLVNIVQGMDRDTVQSIHARTLPPALPKPVGTPTPSQSNGKGGTGFTKAFKTISPNHILILTGDIITIGEPGTKTSKAYRLNASTAVFINNKKGDIHHLHVGMDAAISSIDGTTAAEIRAIDK